MTNFNLIPKKTGIAATLDALKKVEDEKRRAAGTLQTASAPVDNSPEAIAKRARLAKGYIEPELAKHRIRIIFDDSGSMRGTKIEDARNGCIEFMRTCAFNEVACAIHPMNMEDLNLDTNLPVLAALIKNINATTSTPLYETLAKAQDSTPSATRYIVFSDGQADDTGKIKDQCIARAIEAKTPVDTVYISDYSAATLASAHSTFRDFAHDELKELAERTGGFFLVFDRNKINFSTAFKYLSPGLRHLLASESFRHNLQEGKI